MTMNFSKFRAGTYKQQYQYKSFSPSKINCTWTWDDPVFNVLLEDATRKLGELNAFTLIVPNIELFIQMYIVKEANNSSKKYYIQSTSLNGKNYNNNYLQFDDIQNGGEFIFDLSDAPNKNWGSKSENVPYSLSRER